MKPLVSILIPAFNSETWIAETLKSAIEQTWERKEIIVVDDGSSDQTLTIVKRFASKGVSIATQANQGAAAARNKAFSLSQGDYIQWLDADDLLAPDKIARQMAVAERHDNERLLLSSAWGTFLYRPEKVVFVPSTLWDNLSPIEWLLRKLEHGHYMQTGTWLVSRVLTQAAGPWDARLSFDDDGEYFCRVLLKSEGTRFVPEARVLYRMSGVSSLSYIGRSNRKLDSLSLSIPLHIACIRSLEESERVRHACLKYLQKWFMYFYPERADIIRQMEQIATTLGGQLVVTPLSWKYNWMRPIVGWRIAKRAQMQLPQYKWAMIRAWEKVSARFTSEP